MVNNIKVGGRKVKENVANLNIFLYPSNNMFYNDSPC